MKKSIVFFCAALLLGACASKTQKEEVKEEKTPDVEAISLDGKWKLVSYATDSATVVAPIDNDYMLIFTEADSSFGMKTDCNGIGGAYKINGDTLRFDNVGATQMLCDKMEVEDAMKAMFSNVATFTVVNDTVLNIAVDGKQVAEFQKCNQ